MSEFRQMVVPTAQCWFVEAHVAAQKGDHKHAWLYLMNALNHTENALVAARRALEPFSKIADVYDASEDDAFQLWQDAHEPDTRVTLGQCRTARTALAPDNQCEVE